MNFLLRLGLLTLLASVTQPLRAQDFAYEEVYVDRITYSGGKDSRGNPTYFYETGKLYTDGNGFIAMAAYTKTAYLDDSDEPSVAQLQAVSGAFLMQLGTWVTLNNAIPTKNALRLFARSAGTYSLGAVKYVTIAIAGSNPGTGIVVPVSGTGPRLLNLSFRAIVPADGNIIPGFVIADTPNHDKMTVLLRVSGPTLASYGVTATLADPRFLVYDKDKNLVGGNDDWTTSAAEKELITSLGAKAGAFPLLNDSKDSAAVLSLPPGSYTALVKGAPGTTGEVLVEVYAIEN